MTSGKIDINLHESLSGIAPADWDACACPEAADGGRARDPFTTHRFLSALEKSGSIGPGTGWQALYLTAHKGPQMIAAAPMYAKSHSQGEYVFDHSWAHAFENAGGRYYPKLQISVPFTPVTGRRLLTLPGHEEEGRAALLQGAISVARDHGLSSLHVTFCTADEARAGENPGLLHRLGQQFHWENHGYADFDAFLASLSSRKRKNIRKEREVAQGFGGRILSLTGDQIEPAHWDAFWTFYQDTGARKWGRPYLTRGFFERVHETLRQDILLVLAENDSGYIAGALNFIGRDALFGRYWGAVEHHPMLHFELCYYQAIDFALRQGLARVEAGAQGEHKLARGYLPSATHSLHWIGHDGLRAAVERFIGDETDALGEDMDYLTALGPFKRGGN